MTNGGFALIGLSANLIPKAMLHSQATLMMLKLRITTANGEKMSYENHDLLPNPHPGILLKEDFLDEMGITPYRLAISTGLTPTHVSELLKGKRNITPTTALLLGKFFDTTPEYWINLQARYDMMEAKRSIGDRLAKVQPYQAVASR